MGSGRETSLSTRADGPVAPLGAPLTVDRARPGDLIFVGAEPTALGAVVGELDGCSFSHVGVLAAGSPPTLLSARTDRHGGLRSPDLGGVRRNDLADLVDRGLWVAPLVLPEPVRAAGLALLEEWEEVDAGPDRASRSRFSYAKLIITATALASVRRRDPLHPVAAGRLWEASVRAAEELRWSAPFPGFYCAELIAAIYGLTYSTDAFWVPVGEPHPGGPPGPPTDADAGVVRAGDDLRDGVVDLREATVASVHETFLDIGDVIRASFEIGLTRRQVRSIVHLLVVVWRHDRPLGERIVAASRELRPEDGVEPPPHHPTRPPAEPFVPPAFLAEHDGPLPTALVTPRLLLSERVVRSVHPLVL